MRHPRALDDVLDGVFPRQQQLGIGANFQRPVAAQGDVFRQRHDAIGRHVLTGQAIFADDTPVKMLAPGTGKTATARQQCPAGPLVSVVARSEMLAPEGSPVRISRSMHAASRQQPLNGPAGQWKATPGSKIYTVPANCAKSPAWPMSVVSSSTSTGRKGRPSPSAIADEAIRRYAQLYAVEKEARGSSPERRVDIREAKAAAVFDGLQRWLHAQLPTISGKSPLVQGHPVCADPDEKLRPYLDHGIHELVKHGGLTRRFHEGQTLFHQANSWQIAKSDIGYIEPIIQYSTGKRML